MNPIQAYRLRQAITGDELTPDQAIYRTPSNFLMAGEEQEKQLLKVLTMKEQLYRNREVKVR